MTYQVLARKLRPADFSALVGQDHVVQALSHALDNDRLHHAYLFTGTRGVGKTTIARILARCLNCEQGVSSSPCGECDTCLAITEGRFVDLIEMDGASQRGVENVHELQDGAQYMPNSGRYKVYLIDEVHMLTTHAFNALLKILEEPPDHVKFLLATTEVKKVPVTILSRCLQFQLKNMTVERIASYLADALTEETVEFDAGALRIIGTAANGSMRDALSVTDQAISFGGGKLEEASVARMLGVTGRDEITAMLSALATGEAAQVLACSAELAARGVDFASVLADLLRAFHDIAVAQMLDGDAVEHTDEERGTDLVTDGIGHTFAGQFAPDVVQLFYQLVLRSHRDLAMSPDPRIGFEMALLRLLAFAPADVASSVPPLSSPSGPQTGGSSSESGDPAASAASESAGEAMQTGARSVTSQPVPPSSAHDRVSALIDTKASESDEPLPRASDPFWADLQNQLPAQGVLAMITRNCVLLGREELPGAAQKSERWTLQLDPAHDGMLSERHPVQIESLVSEATQIQVKVTLSIGEPPWETPGMQFARERQERHSAAVQEMRDNKMVQSLLDTFGARLDEDTVRSVTNPSATGSEYDG